MSTRARTVYPGRMSDAEKQARLAEALRANLRKRMAQARDPRADAGVPREHGAEPEPQRERIHSPAK